MSDLFDFSPRGDRYVVFGNPIAHSQSPWIHQYFARQQGVSLSYERQLVEPGGFSQAVDQFRTQGGVGANVTVPFKQKAYAYAEQHSQRAKQAGAVNTLVFSNGLCLGDNTDGDGLVADLQRLGVGLAGSRILLAGAGGAAAGILAPLLDAEPELIWIVNRSEQKAGDLVQRFASAPLQAGGYGSLAQATVFDLIINSTASSLHDEDLPIPEHCLGSDSVSYDLMYGPRTTRFQAWSRAQGCTQAYDGLGMLVEQAALAWQRWHGSMPDTQDCLRDLRHQLARA